MSRRFLRKWILLFLFIGTAVTFFWISLTPAEGDGEKKSVHMDKKRTGGEPDGAVEAFPGSFRETVFVFDEKKYLEKTLVKAGEDAYKRNKFNQVESDKLASNRQIPDSRNHQCQAKTWPSKLPSTTVIITFHNEARSTLLRTVVSVLNRSPSHLIDEIILIDDFSDESETGSELARIEKVKVLRNEQREGLIRSRIIGAKAAKSKVLTFLDSHCECNAHWLEPLLQRIDEDESRVVCPIIDVISMDNFNYIAAIEDLYGGFGWDMVFRWDHMNEEERQKRIGDPTAAIRTPVMAGGLFAISKAYFEKIGFYDPEMNVWGGENIEISLRVWLCGGTLEIVPCSRVGHVFRKQHPYSFPGGSGNVFARNTVRAVEVWLDDYREYYYQSVPSSRFVQAGNLTARFQLKKRLECKTFQWFLENVYPRLKVPNPPGLASGEIRHGLYCLDAKSQSNGGAVELITCHGNKGAQDWVLSKENRIRNNDFCLTVPKPVPGEPVVLNHCKPEATEQQFELSHHKKLIKMQQYDLCLDSSEGNQQLVVNRCDFNVLSQHFKFSRIY